MVSQPRDDTTIRLYGRRYHRHAVEHRIYCIPVDEIEEERLHEWYQILDLIFGQRLLLAPLSGPRRVLECGFGEGSWAENVAEQISDCQVTGIDLFLENRANESSGSDEDPDDECDASMDVGAEVFHKRRWNLNEPLGNNRDFRRNRYDAINLRGLAEGIDRSRWQTMVWEMKSLLIDGGWLQMVEFHFSPIQLSSGRLDDAPNIQRWNECYRRGMEQMNRDPRVALSLGRLMSNAGFVNVQHSAPYVLPIGTWNVDQRILGRRILDNMESTLISLALWPACALLGMTEQEFGRVVQGAMQELQDATLKPYVTCYVAIGQRAHGRAGN